MESALQKDQFEILLRFINTHREDAHAKALAAPEMATLKVAALALETALDRSSLMASPAVGIWPPTRWAPNGFAAIPTAALDPPRSAASPAVPALIGSGSPSQSQLATPVAKCPAAHSVAISISVIF